MVFLKALEIEKSKAIAPASSEELCVSEHRGWARQRKMDSTLAFYLVPTLEIMNSLNNDLTNSQGKCTVA